MSWRHVTVVELDAPTVKTPETGGLTPLLQICAAPPIWTLPPTTATLEVPVFVSLTWHWLFDGVDAAAPAVQDNTCALTCAELVNDPNRPNTNPAMAIAAMRVMAISITVAKTGEIAFLFLVILKVFNYRSYDQVPENGTVAPLLRLNEPTA
jgi:hypothetical protein